MSLSTMSLSQMEAHLAKLQEAINKAREEELRREALAKKIAKAEQELADLGGSVAKRGVSNNHGYSVGPIGYEACFGCGHAPKTYRPTSQTKKHRGCSHILYHGRPCFWNDGDGRAFPKARVADGIQEIDGCLYYTGWNGKRCMIDHRFGKNLGYGRSP